MSALLDLYAALIGLQRELYLAFSGAIRAYAESGDWTSLLAFAPLGLVLGAVHALTPGHSKALLAIYLAGAPTGAARALGAAVMLAVTHIAVSAILAAVAAPVFSLALGSVGRAPALEDLSRGLLGAIGLWMLWAAFRPRRDHGHAHRPLAFGLAAGLIPCPLTLFVMTMAIGRGAPEAGLAFAAMMAAGVALTLSAVALFAVLARRAAFRAFDAGGGGLRKAAAALQAATGAVLIIVAINEVAA